MLSIYVILRLPCSLLFQMLYIWLMLFRGERCLWKPVSLHSSLLTSLKLFTIVNEIVRSLIDSACFSTLVHLSEWYHSWHPWINSYSAGIVLSVRHQAAQCCRYPGTRISFRTKTAFLKKVSFENSIFDDVDWLMSWLLFSSSFFSVVPFPAGYHYHELLY